MEHLSQYNLGWVGGGCNTTKASEVSFYFVLQEVDFDRTLRANFMIEQGTKWGMHVQEKSLSDFTASISCCQCTNHHALF